MPSWDPPDLACLERIALLRPIARIHLATWEARVEDKSLRAAFAIWSWSNASPIRFGMPCDRCGLWTKYWCDSCPQLLPPAAVCESCHAAQLVCSRCAILNAIRARRWLCE
jgi:hypothetical protein